MEARWRAGEPRREVRPPDPAPVRRPAARRSRRTWCRGTSRSSWTATAAGPRQRGLPRTAGHEQGERSLFDVVEGAIEIGVKAISAYAFSTENWTRSPDEVRS